MFRVDNVKNTKNLIRDPEAREKILRAWTGFGFEPGFSGVPRTSRTYNWPSRFYRKPNYSIRWFALMLAEIVFNRYILIGIFYIYCMTYIFIYRLVFIIMHCIISKRLRFVSLLTLKNISGVTGSGGIDKHKKHMRYFVK